MVAVVARMPQSIGLAALEGTQGLVQDELLQCTEFREFFLIPSKSWFVPLLLLSGPPGQKGHFGLERTLRAWRALLE